MRRVVAISAAAVLFLAGCGSDDDTTTDPTPDPTETTSPAGDVDDEAMLDNVSVEFDEDGTPQVTLDGEIQVEVGVATLLSDGDGPPLSDFSRLEFTHHVLDSITGDVLISSFDGSSPPMRGLPNEPLSLPSELEDALEGAHIGANVLWLVPNPQAERAEVSIFHVADGWNHYDYAEGEAGTPAEGLPTVELDDNHAPTVTIPDTAAPEELIVETLIEGDGPEIEAGMEVLMNYALYTWDDGELQESSWESGPFMSVIGGGRLIQAWDEGVPGHKLGSQLLIVAPPELGYGGSPSHPLSEDTLVFVVDLLDITG